MEFPEFYTSRYTKIIECLITKCSQYFHNICSIFVQYFCILEFLKPPNNISIICIQYMLTFAKYLLYACNICTWDDWHLHALATIRKSTFFRSWIIFKMRTSLYLTYSNLLHIKIFFTEFRNWRVLWHDGYCGRKRQCVKLVS